MKMVIGIDEAGRGPLAGPVTVGAFGVVSLGDILREAPAPLTDSKQLTRKQREDWYRHLTECQKKGWCKFSVASSPATFIDRHGLTKSVNRALAKALDAISPNPKTTFIFLDGGLKAPVHYQFQTTIIRGDSAVPAIALASIVAKVTRDRYMLRMAQKFPTYGFDRHVGYGTRIHRQAISIHGPCHLHRRSFLSGVLGELT